MSKDVKKYFCIKGCLPVINKEKSSSKTSKMAKNIPPKNENRQMDGHSVRGLPLVDEERLRHTSKWVQNVSTQANYDPEATLMEDSRDDSCLKLYPPEGDSILSSRRRLKSRCHADNTSLSSSCVSLATEVVSLNVDDCRSLGITIVGHTNGPQGDCGIFVGCVKKGGVAEMSGRIEPGDLILEVNGIDLEKMSNDKALAILKGEVAKGGVVRLMLAKYWDMEELKGNESQFYGGFEPIYEPTPSIVYSEAHNNRPHLPPSNNNPFYSKKLHPPYHTTTTSKAYHTNTTIPTTPTPPPSFLPEMRRPFQGSELVDWIQDNIAGMRARNEARSYAQSMLNNGFITSREARFHEDGWYVVQSPNSF